MTQVPAGAFEFPRGPVSPAHLQDLNEGGATGIDQRSEVSRIMAARPDRVMTMAFIRGGFRVISESFTQTNHAQAIQARSASE